MFMGNCLATSNETSECVFFAFSVNAAIHVHVALSYTCRTCNAIPYISPTPRPNACLSLRGVVEKAVHIAEFLDVLPTVHSRPTILCTSCTLHVYSVLPIDPNPRQCIQ